MSGWTYDVRWERSLTISAEALIEAFPNEWEDAKARGLDEDGFAKECLEECDYDTLARIGDEGLDDYDVTTLTFGVPAQEPQ